jgi:hypothetical protein
VLRMHHIMAARGSCWRLAGRFPVWDLGATYKLATLAKKALAEPTAAPATCCELFVAFGFHLLGDSLADGAPGRFEVASMSFSPAARVTYLGGYLGTWVPGHLGT